MMRSTARPSGRTAGLTLIEVMIAVLVLGVGVIGAAGLQATALNATRTAEATQRLAATARSELDVVRGMAFTTTEATTTNCVTSATGCTLAVLPCFVASGGTLDCTLAMVSEPAAHAVVVHVVENDRELRLRTVVLR